MTSIACPAHRGPIAAQTARPPGYSTSEAIPPGPAGKMAVPHVWSSASAHGPVSVVTCPPSGGMYAVAVPAVAGPTVVVSVDWSLAGCGSTASEATSAVFSSVKPVDDSGVCTTTSTGAVVEPDASVPASRVHVAEEPETEQVHPVPFAERMNPADTGSVSVTEPASSGPALDTVTRYSRSLSDDAASGWSDWATDRSATGPSSWMVHPPPLTARPPI